MKLPNSLSGFATLIGLALLSPVFTFAETTSTKPAAPIYDPTHTAKQWVPLFAEDWWNHYHPDYQAWYPGGRSNRFHDMWIAKVMIKHAQTKDWEIINRDYAFDGQWFAVEWHYRSTYIADGFRQWETTLAFAKIHEGKKSCGLSTSMTPSVACKNSGLCRCASLVSRLHLGPLRRPQLLACPIAPDDRIRGTSRNGVGRA